MKAERSLKSGALGDSRGKSLLFCLGLTLLISLPAPAIDVVVDSWGNLTSSQRQITQIAISEWEGVLTENPHEVHLDLEASDLGRLATLAADAEPVLGKIQGIEGPGEWITLAVTYSFEYDQHARPIGANITFNTNSAIRWHVGTEAPPVDEIDWLSVARHEICHALGFTINCERFLRNVTPGPGNNRTYNAGGTPTATLVNINQGTHLDPVFHPNRLMGPAISDGVRRDISGLEVSLLEHDVFLFSLSVFSITPNWGISGTVHISDLAGAGFQAGASVKLRHEGRPDIPGTSVVVVSDNRITCDFNISGAAKGSWDVVVTNPDGRTGTLRRGFVIGQTTDGGEEPCIAVASDGTVDIVHLEDWGSVSGRSSYLRHTAITDSAWSTQVVASVNSKSFLHPWIDLGASNEIHIGYVEGWNYGTIKHCVKTGSLICETVDSSASPNYCGSDGMAMGVSGSTVHFVYEKDRNAGAEDGLRWAKKNGSWAYGWLDTDYFDGSLAAMTDSSGNLHIVYALDDNIYYRRRPAGGSWEGKQLVHSGAGMWYHGRSGIAVDSGGKVHITYAGEDLGNRPYYANNVSGSWVNSIIDDSADCDSGFARIACAPDDTLHAAYFDYNSNVVKYAVYGGSSWTITTLDDQDEFCGPDIAVDTHATVHIVYGHDGELCYRWFPTHEQLTIVAAPSSGGTTEPAPGTHSYLHGTEVTITAYTASGWVFDSWSGDASGTDPITVVRVDAEKTAVAHFAPKDILAVPTDVNVPEGSTAGFQVRLAGRPSSNVVVSVARYSGDTDITVQSGSSLSFTPMDWDQYQTVTLAAAQDVDSLNGTAVICCSASEWTSAYVTAIEGDDDECLGRTAPEYDDWVAWDKPDCWCYPRQCRGDADGIQTGPFWVAIPDLNLVRGAINKEDAVLGTIPGGICCDFDHLKTGPFRVAIPDLNILRQYINKPLGQVPMCDEPPLYTGPYNFWRSP